jgi:hypothetical protein
MTTDDSSGRPSTSTTARPVVTTPTAVIVAVWLVVGIPLAYGISQTLLKAAKLFAG